MSIAQHNFRKLSVASYKPTAEFKEIQNHMAVCFDDDEGLVAVTGTYEPDNINESLAYSNLFAAAPELLEILEDIQITECSLCEGTGECPPQSGDACCQCGGCGEVCGYVHAADIKEVIAKAKGEPK